jgi:hypothetical protein
VAQAIPVLRNSTQTLLKQWADIQKNALPQLKSQLNISALPKLPEGTGAQPLGITTNRDEE